MHNYLFHITKIPVLLIRNNLKFKFRRHSKVKKKYKSMCYRNGSSLCHLYLAILQYSWCSAVSVYSHTGKPQCPNLCLHAIQTNKSLCLNRHIRLLGCQTCLQPLKTFRVIVYNQYSHIYRNTSKTLTYLIC